MFPLEIWTMLGSTVIGAVFKLISMKMEATRQREEMILSRLGVEVQDKENVRKNNDKDFKWTRRFIAVSAVTSIIVLPKLAVLFSPDLPIVFGWTGLEQGIWPFTDDQQVVKWFQSSGLITTPLDTHLVSAITGLYFGTSVVGAK